MDNRFLDIASQHHGHGQNRNRENNVSDAHSVHFTSLLFEAYDLFIWIALAILVSVATQSRDLAFGVLLAVGGCDVVIDSVEFVIIMLG